MRFAFEESCERGVGVDRWRVILHEATGVRSGSVVAVEVAAEHAEHGHLLAAVMRGVRDAAGEDPGARAGHVEECGWTFPPGVVFGLQGGESLGAEVGIFVDKGEAGFFGGERRGANIDAEHGAEPEVFADALMDHLFADGTAAGIAGIGAEGQVGVSKFAPGAEDFEAFGGVSFHEKVVAHSGSPQGAALLLQ